MDIKKVNAFAKEHYRFFEQIKNGKGPKGIFTFWNEYDKLPWYDAYDFELDDFDSFCEYFGYDKSDYADKLQNEYLKAVPLIEDMRKIKDVQVLMNTIYTAFKEVAAAEWTDADICDPKAGEWFAETFKCLINLTASKLSK